MSRIPRLRRLKSRTGNARDTLAKLWQSGGLLILGGLAAGMTAFPDQTLKMLRPFSIGVVYVWKAGLGGLDAVGSAGRASAQAVRNLAWGVRETDDLKRRVLSLEEKAIAGEESERGIIRMRELLRLKKRTRSPSLAARVIGGDPSTAFTTLVLDAGARDGIREGAAVLAPAGAVGRIISVGPGHSVALWLSDPRSRIAAYVQRSRVVGVLVGTGQGCELKYLSVGDDVRVGDRVLTAGRGSAFPKGVFVGIVKEVRREGLLLSAAIAPAVEVRRLEEVLVLDAVGQPVR